MYQGIRNDECLICESSLLLGLDLYHLLIDDVICYQCRNKLNGQLKYSKFNGYTLFSFYEYSSEISRLLIRYKDLLDKPLAEIFLKEYMWLINHFFKKYQVVIIPSSKTLLERRSFNHLELILANCNLKIVDCLKKADSIQRFSKDNRQVSFEFKYQPKSLDKIIIFDDVMTSGNSMLEAIRLLEPLAKKIILISITTNKNLILEKGENYARKSKMV